MHGVDTVIMRLGRSSVILPDESERASQVFWFNGTSGSRVLKFKNTTHKLKIWSLGLLAYSIYEAPASLLV
jgi:hypothetical protein